MTRDERFWQECTLRKVQAVQADLLKERAEKNLSSRLQCEASAIDLYFHEIRQRMVEIEKLLSGLGRPLPTEDE